MKFIKYLLVAVVVLVLFLVLVPLIVESESGGMGVGGISIWQLMIVIVIVSLIIVFRRRRKKNLIKRKSSPSSPLDKHLNTSPTISRNPNTPPTISKTPKGPKGWVYVATMDNTVDVLKIGCSERDPEIRIGEWDTGQPGEAHIAYAVLVEQHRNFESRVHQKLSEFRQQGEWFRCDLDTVVSAIQASGSVLYVDDRRIDKWK